MYHSRLTLKIAEELRKRVVYEGEVVDREKFLREHEKGRTLNSAVDAIDIVTGFKRKFNKVTRDGDVEEVIAVNRNKRRLFVRREKTEDDQPEVSYRLEEFIDDFSSRRR